MARPLRNYNKSNFKENVNPTKMKKIAILWLAAMLAGCSTTPRVVADVTEMLPSQSAEKVVIYDTDKSVPAEARAIGKVSVTDGGMTPTNIGVLGQLGVEHMFSDRIGIGLQLNTFTMRMKRPDNMDTSKYDFYGIRRLDAQIGLRFYL